MGKMPAANEMEVVVSGEGMVIVLREAEMRTLFQRLPTTAEMEMVDLALAMAHTQVKMTGLRGPDQYAVIAQLWSQRRCWPLLGPSLALGLAGPISIQTFRPPPLSQTFSGTVISDAHNLVFVDVVGRCLYVRREDIFPTFILSSPFLE